MSHSCDQIFKLFETFFLLENERTKREFTNKHTKAHYQKIYRTMGFNLGSKNKKKQITSREQLI